MRCLPSYNPDKWLCSCLRIAASHQLCYSLCLQWRLIGITHFSDSTGLLHFHPHQQCKHEIQKKHKSEASAAFEHEQPALAQTCLLAQH
jgi:hypothetical protein